MDDWNQAYQASLNVAKAALRRSSDGLSQGDLQDVVTPAVEENFPELQGSGLLPYRVSSIIEALIETEGRILNYDEYLSGAEPVYASGI